MANVSDELSLLERVFLRIGSAETDDQLQNAISKFLPPVLLKLSSQQEGVRKKVMELLIHINKRVKSRPLVQLPVEALLVQYQDPDASSFVINFTIIYIRLGYPRLPLPLQAQLVPTLLSSLEGKPASHQDSLLLIVMPVLGLVTPAILGQSPSLPTVLAPGSSGAPPRPPGLLAGKPHIAAQLAEFMLDMLLLPYGAMVPQEDPAGGAPAVPTPPGMSEYGFKRVRGETPLKPEDIEQIKMGIVKFISAGVLPDADILPHLVVAVADTRFSVANAADMEMKKIVGGLDWSSPSVTAPLYHLFLGTTLLRCKSKATPPQRRGKEEFRRKPANTRIRLKTLPYLLRCRGPALLFPDCIQIFFDCLYGTMTNARLKTMALQFSMLIIENASKDRLAAVSTILCSGLLKLFSDESVEREHKMLAYSAVGKLGSKMPHLVNKDLTLLKTFFEALSQEDNNTRMSVREALLNMCGAFKMEPTAAEGPQQPTGGQLQLSASAVNPPKAFVPSQLQPAQPGTSDETEPIVKDKRARFEEGVVGSLVEGGGGGGGLLHALLASQIECDEPMARFVAVRYVSAVFAPDDAPARFLLLLASGDSQEEVFTEALKALYGVTRRNQALDDQALDDQALEGKDGGVIAPTQRLPPFPAMVAYVWGRAQHRMGGANTRTTAGTHSLPFAPNIYTEILNYLRLCLASSAGIKAPAARALQHPCPRSPLIGRYLQRHVEDSAMGDYLALTQQLLAAQPGLAPVNCLLEVVGTAPERLAPALALKLPGIKSLLSSTREEVREASALLYGITLAYGLPDPEYEACIRDLIRDSSGQKSLESRHGATLALAGGLERKLTRGGAAVAGFKEGVECIVSLLSHPHAMLVGAACSAIGQLGRCAALPLAAADQLTLADKLLAVVQDSKLTSKLRERAARAVGLLCVGEGYPHRRHVIQACLDMAKQTKDIEVHLTIGEALVCAVQGAHSAEARDAWAQLESEFIDLGGHDSSGDLDEDLQYVLEQLLTVYAPVPHPHSRQATCVWLLALLRHCSKRPAVLQRLERMQRCFMELLSEDSEIVQDVAGKGLALVYESADEALRKALVADLLDQLTSGRRTVAQVTSETQLFEEGALGKAPTGGNLSTYKELCSLASDLNQPDLIYKFMHLANHNAVWNSKKGAAFGFVSLAGSAGIQLGPHLPRIVPRLYRYQFDPTPKIQLAMSSIWQALVPESNKTIELYHAEIFSDLLTNLTAGQWRVRISCCLALSDFLRGTAGAMTLRDAGTDLAQLWTQLFRVMDDVHEGTRTAAGNTTRLLSKLCVRCCDVSTGQAGEAMLTSILPVILKVGITNTVAEVRAVSLQTMSQLVGAAGKQLQPHLSQLIPALLEATGELESRGLTQLSVQYGADNRTQEVIDSVRASAAKSHYTTETVVKCLQYVDASVLEELIPRTLELMRSSVGLGTRVACAHLIELLVSHMKQDLQPYTGKLLAALVNGLTDRNAAVRKQYASTIGHLLTTAKDSSVEKLLNKLNTWYLEKEDENVRMACGLTLQAIAAHSQDTLKDNAELVAPMAFFAMHAAKPPEGGGSAEVWTEVWSEITSGTESGIRRHASAICRLLQTALESPSWTQKAQAAQAVGTVAGKAGHTLEAEHRTLLVDILLTGLAGRTWQGKEQLLIALATLATTCKETMKLDAEVTSRVVEAAMKECRKQQAAYKIHALRALGNILSALEVDRFDQVYEVVQDTLNKDPGEGSDSEGEGGADGGGRKRETLLQLKEVVYETLGKAWPSNPLTQERHREQLLERCVSCLGESTRPVQVAMLAALRCYVDRLCLLQEVTTESSTTGEEKMATGEEKMATGEEKMATGEEKMATGEEKMATGEEKMATGEEKMATGEEEMAMGEEVAMGADEEALERILDKICEAVTFALGVSKYTRLRKEALNVLFALCTRLKAAGRHDQLIVLAKRFERPLADTMRDTAPEVRSRVVDIRDLLATQA